MPRSTTSDTILKSSKPVLPTSKLSIGPTLARFKTSLKPFKYR